MSDMINNRESIIVAFYFIRQKYKHFFILPNILLKKCKKTSKLFKSTHHYYKKMSLEYLKIYDYLCKNIYLYFG